MKRLFATPPLLGAAMARGAAPCAAGERASIDAGLKVPPIAPVENRAAD